jgi:hypothetical protein
MPWIPINRRERPRPADESCLSLDEQLVRDLNPGPKWRDNQHAVGRLAST